MTTNSKIGLAQPQSGWILLLLVVGSFWGFLSCDDPFIPIDRDNNYYFAMHGFLDASADTQWIRVMPIRSSIELEQQPPPKVTLTHLESGTSTIMNDSLFNFTYTHGWNFWTTMELHPTQTYQLVAERSDGATSSATVTLPEDFPTPVLRSGNGDFDFVQINGVDILADVQTRYYYGDQQMVAIPHIQDTVSRPEADIVVAINAAEDLATFREQNVQNYRQKQLFVAAGGPEWPPMGTIDENLISMPDGVTNIQNGAGYVAGIVSKTLPYRSCYEDGELAPCPLE